MTWWWCPPQPFGNQNAMQFKLEFPKMEWAIYWLTLFEASNGNQFNKFDRSSETIGSLLGSGGSVRPIGRLAGDCLAGMRVGRGAGCCNR